MSAPRSAAPCARPVHNSHADVRSIPPWPEGIDRFRHTIPAYYRLHGRRFPWRETRDPYGILVSEIMLQQTQVERVRPKYGEFLRDFPTIEALAESSLKAVLEVWRGLGYNRRALSLHRLAGVVVAEFGGALPRTRDELLRLPGVGPSTAGALMAFAFQQPVAFIETNIRRVFLHFFFPKRVRVPDAEILPFVEATLDGRDVRAWYYALMDYGAMLGKAGDENPNRRSSHYRKQSPFKGSNREIRGLILRTLLENGPQRVDAVFSVVGGDSDRTQSALKALAAEGLVEISGRVASITGV